MNTTTTRWLIVLALVLGGFILLVERRTDDTARSRNRANLLLPQLQVGQVDEFAVVRGTNLACRVTRQRGQWEFRNPIVYPAQAVAVERFLAALAETRWQSRLSAQEVLTLTNGLAAFGFEPPAASVAIQQGSNRFEVRFGGPTLLGGQVYAQVVGQTGLFTTDTAILRLLPASISDWRDTALVSLANVTCDRVEVRAGTNALQRMEIVRNPTNRLWEMTKPLFTRADSARIDLLLQQLDLCRVSRFVVDDPRADLESYGLQPPGHELVLSQGTNDQLTLQIGRSPTNDADHVYVRRLTHSNVVLVPKAAVAPWQGGFREFCDRRLMTFKVDEVGRIEVHADEPFALVRLADGGWQIVEPRVAAADPVLVLEMLQQLAELEFLEFEREVVTDFTAYGLAPPRRQYLLQSMATNQVGQATPTIIAQLDLGNPSGVKYFARRSLESSVVTMIDNQRLPRAAYQLRDRRIWNLSTNAIVGITIQQSGTTKRVVRTGPVQWEATPGSPGPVNSLTLEEAAYRIGHLRAERWVARGEGELARYGFSSLDHQVTLEVRADGETKTYTVRFGRQTPSGRAAYAAVHLEGEPGPVIFECPAFIYEFVQSDLSLTAAL